VAGGSVGSKMEMKVAERLAYWGSRADRGKRGRPHLNI